MAINPSGIALHRTYKPQILIHPSFDQIARDYQRFRIPRPPEFDPEGTSPGLICWGTVGAMPSPEPIGGTDFAVKEVWQEKSRKSEIVRVENPDDPNQYVMEDRPQEVRFTKTITDPDTGNTFTSEKTVDSTALEAQGIVSIATARNYEAIMRYQVTGIQDVPGG